MKLITNILKIFTLFIFLCVVISYVYSTIIFSANMILRYFISITDIQVFYHISDLPKDHWKGLEKLVFTNSGNADIMILKLI